MPVVYDLTLIRTEKGLFSTDWRKTGFGTEIGVLFRTKSESLGESMRNHGDVCRRVRRKAGYL